MNWFFVILCTVFAALFPDLPLLAQRLFGTGSTAPENISWVMFLGSTLFLVIYMSMKGSKGRWLGAAYAAVSVIGIGAGALALLGMNNIMSPNLYNIFRGFPSHLFQVVAVVFLLVHVFENMGRRRAAG